MSNKKTVFAACLYSLRTSPSYSVILAPASHSTTTCLYSLRTSPVYLPLFPENKPNILSSYFGSSLTQYNNLPFFPENKPILSSHFGSSLTQYNNLPLFSENKPILSISHFGSSLTQYNSPLCALMIIYQTMQRWICG